MYSFRYGIFVCLCFFFCGKAVAQYGRHITIIDTAALGHSFSNYWYYTEADNATYSQSRVDDSLWILKSSFLTNKPDSIFKGHAWMRKYFRVDASLRNIPLAISVNQYGASEIYLDGSLLYKAGVVGNATNSIYYDPQELPVVFSIADTGIHNFAVHYVNYDAKEQFKKHEIESSGFDITIETAKDAIDSHYMTTLSLSIILLVLCVIFFILALLHLLLFAFFRESKSNLYFSLFSLCLGFALLAPYINSIVHSPGLQISISGIMPYLIISACLFLSLFINDLFSSKRGWRFWLIAGLGIIIFSSLLFRLGIHDMLSLLLLIIVLIESVFLIIRAIFRKVRGAKIIGMGILFFALFLLTMIALSAFSDGDYTINNNTPGGKIILITMGLAVLSIPLSMSVYLAWKFASVNRDLSRQIIQTRELAAINLQQEQEKQILVLNQNKILEEKVTERTEQLQREKKKSDDLLRNILPEEVAEELKLKGKSEAKLYNNVTVLFTDFVNFTGISSKLSPQELVTEIDYCFKAFDEITGKYGLEKIKTVGDAYLAVCGMPNATDKHAVNTILAAKDIITFISDRKQRGGLFEIRIGIHSGPVVAGIVGIKKFAYDIWGDTVNMANRMESSGEPGRINISGTTFNLIKNDFNCEYRGQLEVKNKGFADMYFVN